MIRYTVSIALLVIILFEAGGMIFGYQVRQWIHKVSVAMIMDADQKATSIITMRMKRSEFDRIKVHEREFRLNNEMYDVVWRESEGDEYIIYCFRDAAEEKMAAKFLRFLANGTTGSQTSALAVLHSILIGFILFPPEYQVQTGALPLVELYSCSDVLPSIDRSRCVEPPPPWMMSV